MVEQHSEDVRRTHKEKAMAAMIEAKLQRQAALSEARRNLILDAARTVFAEQGIEGASVREIAKRAGYTPGAIYSYFDSKEAIYGVLLAESLERLNAQVAQVKVPRQRHDKALEIRALAWFTYYAHNPRELDLGFYLARGMQPKGVSSELTARLNTRFFDALRPCEASLIALGVDPAQANRDTVALFAHGLGLLLLHHTGRLAVLGESPQGLFLRYLDSFTARASASAPAASVPAVAAAPTVGADEGAAGAEAPSAVADLQADLFGP